jgi:dihydroorotase
MNLLIQGGTVIDVDGSRRVDVVVEDGLIVEVGENLSAPSGATVLEADGCMVSPGFVDLHTHLREPGGEDAETIETGARAGALGGYTALVAMPNTNPPIDTAAVVEQVHRAGRVAPCHVMASGCITKGRAGEELAPLGELHGLGVRIFTDDGTCVGDAGLMRRALEYARALPGAVLAQHCEDPQLARGGHMNEGAWSSRLGIPGMPAEAESVVVARDIALAALTGGRVHFLHLSSAASVELVRAAKARGLAVTAEAAPHHFTLTDSLCCGYDPLYKVNPPLRTDSDIKAVKEGLADGTIDAIATDHAPHPAQEKERPFDEAPRDARAGDGAGPDPHRTGRPRPPRPTEGDRPPVVAAGPHRRAHRARRTDRRRTARPHRRLRSRRFLGGRSHQAGQPIPQHPLRRPEADRQGAPHDPRR